MRRRKALPAATSRKARGRRRVDQLGGEIGTDAIPDPLVMQSLYVGATCIGFLYSRGLQGVEAFDANTRPLGLFPDQESAVEAVWRAAEGVRHA
jgi:hypothetical protein